MDVGKQMCGTGVMNSDDFGDWPGMGGWALPIRGM